MSDPQVWTLIAVFAAVLFAVLRVNLSAIRGVERSIDGLRRDMVARSDELGGRVDGVRDELTARIDAVKDELSVRNDATKAELSVRIDGVEHRLGAVEDDLKLIKGHLLNHPAS